MKTFRGASRRQFLKMGGLATAGSLLAAKGFTASSYRRILGANDRIRIGVVGFSDRFKDALLPSFLNHNQAQNAQITALSDLWKIRREQGVAHIKQKTGETIQAFPNNEALYDSKMVDAVIISTADFQHALHCIEGVKAGCDVYVEKPFAETMADNRAALAAVKASGKIVQVGSQRRSGPAYHAAYEFINAGKFGPITMAEFVWNVNQPGRWRRPELVAQCKQEDTDWKRYLLNRPTVAWDPRKYLEYRLFWPYSSGMPGQWMCHQIDTVHWFTGLNYPRSVVANGGIYFWKDGRQNWDTMTAVFDYGPHNDRSQGFQVVFTSRMHNSVGGVSEKYFSNGGQLDLGANRVSANGGLRAQEAQAMGMQPNLLTEGALATNAVRAETSASMGGDPLTSLHMLNWLECLRTRKQPNAPVEAGYYHSIASIMTNAAARTGQRATFDANKQEVMAGGKVF
ncbi:MAG TPA: Gfo/Idh/MocA family oxidoreductase, partial [Phnomibacter sp.]|nr:Gfo/Idh/MocA family oxidoreductase [Phnomibacter sp.]